MPGKTLVAYNFTKNNLGLDYFFINLSQSKYATAIFGNLFKQAHVNLITVLCPPKGRTYLNKPAAFSSAAGLFKYV